MPFAAVVRLVCESWHRVAAIVEHCVELAIDETSKARRPDYVTLAADAERRAVIFVTDTGEAEIIEALAADLSAHGGDSEAIEGISIDMSPAYIKGVEAHLPEAAVAFDKFHVIAHASHALDSTRTTEQKRDPERKGLRWTLFEDRGRFSGARRADLEALLANLTTTGCRSGRMNTSRRLSDAWDVG